MIADLTGADLLFFESIKSVLIFSVICFFLQKSFCINIKNRNGEKSPAV